MRKKIVAGNWKMNKTREEALELTREIVAQKPSLPDTSVTLMLFPPFPYLQEISSMTAANGISVGAQNMHEEKSGAYTGEVSADMIKSVGAKHVLIGHSERRQYFGEDGEVLGRKMIMALEAGLEPVYCCGETLEEREDNRHFETVKQQIAEVLFELTGEQLQKSIIAYEPVWAIGTGKTATAEQAQEMHAFIRTVIKDRFGNALAAQMAILYGGSCKPENAAELFAEQDIDGGLIGGASLKAEDFVHIAGSFS